MGQSCGSSVKHPAQVLKGAQIDKKARDRRSVIRPPRLGKGGVTKLATLIP
jgi:hypothetical protein